MEKNNCGEFFKNCKFIDKKTKTMQKIKVKQHAFTAFSWFAGWLFTIGFLGLTFWKGVLAILVWPYYIGVAISHLVQP